MNRRTLSVIGICLGLVLGLAGVLSSGDHVSFADPGILYVAPAGDCGGVTPCYTSVQDAVDAADEGDDIRVATGSYGGVTVREGVAQTAHIG